MESAAGSARVTSLFGENGTGGIPASARRLVVGGQPVFREANMLVVVPWLNYSLQVGTKDRRLTTRIADSVMPTIAPQPIQRDANPSIEGGAVSAHLFYARPTEEEGAYEAGAEVTEPNTAARLAAALVNSRERVAPPQACARSERAATVTFRYANRSPATTMVAVYLGDCDQLTTGDGTGWKLAPAAKTQLLDLLKRK
jgi:hypothetical protein